MASENNLIAKVFCEFLNCLLADATVPVFLLWTIILCIDLRKRLNLRAKLSEN